VYEPALFGLGEATGSGKVEDLPAGVVRDRVFRGLTDTLLALAAPRPLVLVIDDLQWADELSLGWLAYLRHLSAGAGSALPLLVVGTYRTEEVGVRHVSPLRALLEAPDVAKVRLGRLDEAAVRAMIGDMLALSPPPERFAGFLNRHSEGNPFFVAEYLQAAVEEGLLMRDEQGRWQVPVRYEDLPVPRSLWRAQARWFVHRHCCTPHPDRCFKSVT
jgi:predicted ATPase